MNEFAPYKDLQDYLDHLYNVLYLQNESQLTVLHTQHTGNDRVEAIQAARKELGNKVYIISVTKHAQDVNPRDME